MKRRRRLLVPLILLLLLAAAWLGRGQLLMFGHNLATRRLPITVNRFTKKLPTIDHVRVDSLGADVESGTNTVDYGSGRKAIHQTVMVEHPKAAQIVTFWQSLDFTDEPVALCHDPGYRLGFYHDGREVFWTTICWRCENATFPAFGHRWLRQFRGRTEASTNLFALLTNAAPPFDPKRR